MGTPLTCVCIVKDEGWRRLCCNNNIIGVNCKYIMYYTVGILNTVFCVRCSYSRIRQYTS